MKKIRAVLYLVSVRFCKAQMMSCAGSHRAKSMNDSHGESADFSPNVERDVSMARTRNSLRAHAAIAESAARACNLFAVFRSSRREKAGERRAVFTSLLTSAATREAGRSSAPFRLFEANKKASLAARFEN
ncbi:MAG: hypothetical protein HYV96_02595 [Opitutae bacterium]|nr:hypothetical protein [Opitutae bacterium]